MEKKLRIVSSCITSAEISIVFVTVITIVAETYLPLKNWLAATFTHHWLGKGIVLAAIFSLIAVGLILISKKQVSVLSLSRQLQRLNALTIISSFLLTAYFIYHYLSA